MSHLRNPEFLRCHIRKIPNFSDVTSGKSRFANHLRIVRELFANCFRIICELFANYPRIIRELSAIYLQIIGKFFADRVRFVRELFADYPRIIRGLFANYLRTICEIFANYDPLHPLLFLRSTWSLCWKPCSNTGPPTFKGARRKPDRTGVVARIHTSNERFSEWALHTTGLVV